MRIRIAARRFFSLGCIAALLGVAGAGWAVPSPEEAKTPTSAEPPKGDAARGSAAKGEAADAGAQKAAPAKASSQSAARAPAKRAAKNATKPAPRSKAAPKKGSAKLPRKPGEPGEPDESARRVVAGQPAPVGQSVRESNELRAMREIDLTLFPEAAPSHGPAWPTDGTLLLDAGEPRLEASGLPPSGLPSAPPRAEEARDISWLRQLDMPDIPVRWDGRVVRYLEYYKDDPRGRVAVASWIKKSGRYAASVRRVLREQGLPEDLLWLSLVESGFDPTIHSPAGAAGLWQFMPHGARIYGLTVDRWVDERLDPERSTLAAARYLSDLRRRFGGWELAFAAYNMGYGGLLASIRKYNTNDFWELSRLEAGMPLETALYVPKIIAIAIVARNKKVFGCDDVELDPAVTFDKIAVGSGVSLQSVALASGAGSSEIEALNPQLVARRTPPLPVDAKARGQWEVRVPPGSGARAAKSMPKLLESEPKLERYLVRWGESLDDIATFRKTTRSSLQSLNGLRSGESVRPGVLLFVPAPSEVGVAAAEHLLADGAPVSSSFRPTVVVPAQRFSYEGRRRAFYRVVAGDTLRELATVLSVNVDEICRWNTLAQGATLHEGMTLQVFVEKAQRFEGVFLLDEAEARVLEVGSDDFFAHFEGLKGRKRIEIAAKDGDSFAKLASRYGLSLGMMERINHRSRRSPLSAGEKLVVYAPASRPDEAAPVPAPVEAAKEEEEVVVADARAGQEEAAKADARAGGDSAAPGEPGPTRPAVLLTPVTQERAEEPGGDKVARAKDGSDAGAAETAADGRGKRGGDKDKAVAAGGEQKKAAAVGEKKVAVEEDKALAAASEKKPAGDVEKKSRAKPGQREGAKPAVEGMKTAP